MRYRTADIPARLKEARSKAGLSQAALARISGVEPVSIHQYESGYCKPGADSLACLAQSLVVSADYLLGGQP